MFGEQTFAQLRTGLTSTEAVRFIRDGERAGAMGVWRWGEREQANRQRKKYCTRVAEKIQLALLHFRHHET